MQMQIRAEEISDLIKQRIESYEGKIELKEVGYVISVGDGVPKGAVQLLVRGELVALPLAGIIDLAAEEARLDREAARVTADIARIDGKLGNAEFVRRAPEEVVDGEREKREEALARRSKIAEALERVRSAR